MHRLDWVKEEIDSAHGTIEFLLDDVSNTEDITDEDVRAGLISALEDAYEALNEAIQITYRQS